MEDAFGIVHHIIYTGMHGVYRREEVEVVGVGWRGSKDALRKDISEDGVWGVVDEGESKGLGWGWLELGMGEIRLNLW